MNFSPDTWWLMGILVAAATAIIGYFLKRTMMKVDDHDKDINHIKQTYVTKEELKDQRAEFREELSKISETVDDIKEKCLSKTDFYRAQEETNSSIKQIYNLLIKWNGGQNDARK